MKRDIYQNAENARLSVPVTNRDHVQGNNDAPVTLVEYGDYECPACGEAHEVIKMVQQALGPGLRYVYRNFPLTDKHPHAENAAEAAEAADAQGQFWEMHDALFENQDALEDEDLAQYATDLDLDADRLVAEVESGKYQARVQEDLNTGLQNGVDGTPTFFINDLCYDGPVEPEAILAALAQAAER
jgi:protein-disulfide isomerase